MQQVALYPSTFVSGEQRCSLEVRIVNLNGPVAPTIYPDYVDYCDCMDYWTISCIVGPNTSVKFIREIWNYTVLIYWWLVSPYSLNGGGAVLWFHYQWCHFTCQHESIKRHDVIFRLAKNIRKSTYLPKKVWMIPVVVSKSKLQQSNNTGWM